MKKCVALGALVALALVVSPAKADPANGCYASGNETGAGVGIPGAYESAISCSYTAGGDGQYVIASPNPWSIVVTYTDATGVHERSRTEGELAPPSTGSFTAQSGDTVTVSVEIDGVDPVVGTIGIVAAHDAA